MIAVPTDLTTKPKTSLSKLDRELETISSSRANRETRSTTGNGSKRNLSSLKPVSFEIIFFTLYRLLALEEPVAEFSHAGLVAKLTAESSPAAAKLILGIFQCPANIIELKKRGTKENREMLKNLKTKCVIAETYGNKHFIDRELARGFFTDFWLFKSFLENPIGFAIAILTVKDVHGNEETLVSYAPPNQIENRRFSNEEDESFPIQAWFDKM